MDISIGVHLLEAVVFGLVFAGLYYLIIGWPANWRPWIAASVVLAGLAYIILFGLIKAP